MLKTTSGVILKPQKVVIYGPAGIGKTTFAAKFPDPVFIDTEGGTNQIDVKRLEGISSWSMLIGTIKEIKNNPSFCKTLIIDTVDWAEMLCQAHICDINGKKSMESFGYGSGFTHLREEMGKFLNMLSDLIEVGINVVLVAHSILRKFEMPEEAGNYDRYEMKLTAKADSKLPSLIKEWADMVLFVNYKQIVVEIDNKKKVQGGQRVMYTQYSPVWDAKNRHDLKAELPFEYDQISYCIPNHIDSTTKPIEPTAPPEVPKVPEVTKVEPIIQQYNDLSELPRALADLMQANNVTVEEIQKAVYARGYFPQNTPIQNFGSDFIDGVLIGAWDQVFEMIKKEREIPIN